MNLSLSPKAQIIPEIHMGDPLKKQTINVIGHEIVLLTKEKEDYISITDIAQYRNKQEPFAIINNWMRSRSTIEFLGLWEKLSNPDFKPLEFERFKCIPRFSSKAQNCG